MNKEKKYVSSKDPNGKSHYRQVRMKLIRSVVSRLEELRDPKEFHNFTAIVNRLLADYLVTQELKHEFALLNNKSQ